MRHLLVLVAILLLIGCAKPAPKPATPAWTPPPREPETITVFAAASLTDVMEDLATAWHATSGNSVTFSVDATSRLARQIEEGAPADVFVSADEEWMNYCVKHALVDEKSVVSLAGNTLVAIVPASLANPPANREELIAPSIAHIALAGEEVPAGKYARAALESAGIWDALQPRIVRGSNVRTTLMYVAEGHADVGVVYATDAATTDQVKIAFTFADNTYPPITYPAGILRSSLHVRAAREFITFCRSATGQAIFADRGFVPSTAA